MIYTDEGVSSLSKKNLPFKYYYSFSADLTVSICNIDQTVFICPGKLERVITKDDPNECKVTPELLESDLRLK